MKAGLFILPFLALIFGAIGMAIGSSFPAAAWMSAVGWGVGAALVALWIVLDFDNFKVLFTRKGAKYGASSGLVVFLGLVVIVGLASVTSRPRFNKSFDVTREKLNTLSEQSLQMIANAKAVSGQKVQVLGFFVDDAVKTQFRDLLGLYEAAGADFVVEYINPEKDPTRAMAEKISTANTAIFRLGQQEKRITTFNEEKLTNALVNILKEGSKKIYFTTGHGEGELKGTEATGFSVIAQELENNKNEVAALSLLDTLKVPEDANMLVIAGPRYDLKEEETRIIEDYLKRGGSVLAMVDAMVPAVNINKLMEKFGVKFEDDLLILAPDDVRAQLMGQNNAIISDFDAFNPVTKDFAKQSAVALILKNTRTLSAIEDNPNQLKITLAAKSADSMVRVKDVRSPADLEGGLTKDRLDMGGFPVMAVGAGKTQAPATASSGKAEPNKADVSAPAEAAQGKETRLVAIGSVEFAVNGGTAQTAEHRDMFMNMTSYLLQDEDFISIRPKDPTKSSITLTSSTSQLLLLVLAFIYPLVFFGSGLYVWLKRRKA
jgi:ABC-type uncharacterized transport system involved in gliding motility auxiliary subunit